MCDEMRNRRKNNKETKTTQKKENLNLNFCRDFK